MSVGKKHSSKKKLLELTSTLETAAYDDASKFDLMVDAAAQLKDLVAVDGVSLTRTDKIELLKTFTRVKVRAFMAGTTESYRTFRVLETISTDLVRLL